MEMVGPWIGRVSALEKRGLRSSWSEVMDRAVRGVVLRALSEIP